MNISSHLVTKDTTLFHTTSRLLNSATSLATARMLPTEATTPKPAYLFREKTIIAMLDEDKQHNNSYLVKSPLGDTSVPMYAVPMPATNTSIQVGTKGRKQLITLPKYDPMRRRVMRVRYMLKSGSFGETRSYFHGLVLGGKGCRLVSPTVAVNWI